MKIDHEKINERKKEIKKYLSGELDITITPPLGYDIINLSLQRATAIIIIISILLSFLTMGFLYRHYASKYWETAAELEELKSGELQDLRMVNEENILLKNQLYALANDLARLESSVNKLQEYNQQLVNVVGDDVEIENTAFVREHQGDLRLKILAHGGDNLLEPYQGQGGNFSLHYFDPSEVADEVSSGVEQLEQQLTEEQSSMAGLESSVKEYDALRAATPSIWPVADNGEGFISSHFGWRTSPTSGRNEFHEGLDIGVYYGTPVLATANGRVKFAGWRTGYGHTIDIDHGFGYVTRYAHLQQIKVREGEEVKRGELIGLSGNSGTSTGPHLHYEVILNGTPRNPLNYID